MQIDWVTVIAQIVNFLVLVWLLHRFLYGPITRAMKRREQRIQDRLSAADRKQKEAARKAETLRRQQSDLDAQRDAILNEARQEAKALREELEAEAREDAEQQRRAWRHQISDEKEDFLQDLRIRTAHHVYEVARSALAELADADLEARVASRFSERLGELEPERLKKIAQAAREADNTARIESAFELSPDTKRKIAKELREVLAGNLEVTWELSGELLLGIRLAVGAQTVEWSLNHYLERLESNVEEQLARVRRPKEREAA